MSAASVYLFLVDELIVLDIFFLQKSAIEQDIIIIDEDTKNMLESMGFKDLPGTQTAAAITGGRA